MPHGCRQIVECRGAALQCGADMPHIARTITIHPRAPAKVALGTACNGCGVCCLYEPCPLGMLLSRRRSGACLALRWQQDRYRCGVLVDTRGVLSQALPRSAQWLEPALAGLLRRVGARWIAAGTGCDSNLQVDLDEPPSTTMGHPDSSIPNDAPARQPHHD